MLVNQLVQRGGGEKIIFIVFRENEYRVLGVREFPGEPSSFDLQDCLNAAIARATLHNIDLTGITTDVGSNMATLRYEHLINYDIRHSVLRSVVNCANVDLMGLGGRYRQASLDAYQALMPANLRNGFPFEGCKFRDTLSFRQKLLTAFEDNRVEQVRNFLSNISPHLRDPLTYNRARRMLRYYGRLRDVYQLSYRQLGPGNEPEVQRLADFFHNNTFDHYHLPHATRILASLHWIANELRAGKAIDMRGLNLGGLEAINMKGKNASNNNCLFKTCPSVQQMNIIIEELCGGATLPGHPSFDGRHVNYLFTPSVVPFADIFL